MNNVSMDANAVEETKIIIDQAGMENRNNIKASWKTLTSIYNIIIRRSDTSIRPGKKNRNLWSYIVSYPRKE